MTLCLELPQAIKLLGRKWALEGGPRVSVRVSAGVPAASG